MKKLTLISLLAVLTLPLTAKADFLGLYVGGGVWQHAPSGGIGYNDTINADLAGDLKLKGASESYYYVAFEHPVPLIPNYKYVSTTNTNKGSGTITTSFNFGGVTYDAASTVDSVLNLNTTSHIIYYEILDNIVSVDVGLAGIQVTGTASATETGGGNNTTTVNINQMIPTGYYSVGATLPLTGLSVQYEQSILGIAGNEVSDTVVKVMYEMGSTLGLEAGTRSQVIKLNVSGLKTTMTFAGVFAGVYLHF